MTQRAPGSALPAPPPPLRLGWAIAVSAAVHVAVAGGAVAWRPDPPPAVPQMYRVNLIAAPAGERAIGVVQAPPPQPVEPAPTPVRPEAELPAVAMPVPDAKAARTQPRPAQATATTPPDRRQARTTTPAPTAGAGEVGGRGADVAPISTAGIEFPFQGYLDNIVRQVALRFSTSTRSMLLAEVQFMIRRDGSVPPESIRLITKSGVFTFDQEAMAAVEAAAQADGFGPLPAGFREDILPVTFKFQPGQLR